MGNSMNGLSRHTSLPTSGEQSMARKKATVKKARKKAAKKKPIWERSNPRRKHKKLSAQQKAKAKRLAKKAGRPYPNMVDNARVARKK
jgi:hypothetical protein